MQNDRAKSKPNRRRLDNPRCPHCNAPSTVLGSVKDTTTDLVFSRIRRYRCGDGHIFVTKESILVTPSFIILKPTTGQERLLDFDKLTRSIQRSNDNLTAETVTKVAQYSLTVLREQFTPTAMRSQGGNAFAVYLSTDVGNAVLQSFLEASSETSGLIEPETQKLECMNAFYRYSVFFLKLRKYQPPAGYRLMVDNYAEHQSRMLEKLKNTIPQA